MTSKKFILLFICGLVAVLAVTVFVTAVSIKASKPRPTTTHDGNEDGDDDNDDDVFSGENSAALQRIEKTLNENKHQQLTGASLWLNAGATLMQESANAGSERRILVGGKDYDSEMALLRALDIDPKLSVAWHYLSSVLTQQTLHRYEQQQQQQSKMKSKSNPQKLLAKTKAGPDGEYMTVLETIARAVEVEPESAKAWIGASHLLLQLNQIYTSTSDDDEETFGLLQPSILITTDSEKNNNNDDDQRVDAVLCAARSLQLDRTVSTSWTFAGKALRRAQQLGSHRLDNKSLVSRDGNPLRGPSIQINLADPGIRVDAMDCAVNSIALYQQESSVLSLLCEMLGEEEAAARREQRAAKEVKIAPLEGVTHNYKSCLTRLLQDSPADAESWLRLGRELSRAVAASQDDRTATSGGATSPLAFTSPSAFHQGHEDDSSSSASAATAFIPRPSGASGKPHVVTAQQCFEKGFSLLSQSSSSSVAAAAHAIDKDTVRAAWHDMCTVLTLPASIASSTPGGGDDDARAAAAAAAAAGSVRIGEDATIDALQCWESLLVGGKDAALPGLRRSFTVGDQLKMNPRIWYSLGVTLAVAEKRNIKQQQQQQQQEEHLTNKKKGKNKSFIDQIYVTGERFDAAAALVRSIDLDPKSLRTWFALGRLLTFRETKLLSTSSADKKLKKLLRGLPTKVRIGDKQYNGLDIFAHVVEIDPTEISSWELLCHELAEREKVAERERPSVLIQMPVEGKKPGQVEEGQLGEDEQLLLAPKRVEQQLCFMNLLRLQPTNVYAWTNFKLITEGAAVQVPNPDYDFTKRGSNKKQSVPKTLKVDSNLQLRILAVRQFPDEGTLWLQLGQTLAEDKKVVAELDRRTHVSLEQCFQRAVEKMPRSSDAWLFFSSSIAAGETVNVTMEVRTDVVAADGGGTERRRVPVEFDRVRAVLRSIHLNDRNAPAWQQLATFLSEPVLYDSTNEMRIDDAHVEVSLAAEAAGDEGEDEVLYTDKDAAERMRELRQTKTVSAFGAVLRAVALDDSLYGAWALLAAMLRRKEVEEAGGIALPPGAANAHSASVELQTTAGGGTGRRVTAAECLGKAIEISDLGGVRRQSRTVVLSLYQNLLPILQATGRHVSVRGVALLASDVQKKISDLRTQIQQAQQAQRDAQMKNKRTQ